MLLGLEHIIISNVKENVMKTFLQIFLISLLIVSCVSSPIKKPDSLKFKIISKQDNSYMNTSRMVYKVLLDVDSLPTDGEIISTARSIWENENKEWKEFSVSVFLPDMNTESLEYAIVNFTNKKYSKFFKYESVLTGTKWVDNKTETLLESNRIQESNEKAEDTQKRMKEYSIKIIVVPITDKQINVKIETNFPDGTNLNLYGNRYYQVKGVNETYTGDLFETDFSVKNGYFESTININDKEWYDRYQGVARAIPNEYPPISKISDKINIRVVYTAAATQPADVVKILGTRGEFVSGEGVEHFGTGTAGRLTALFTTKEFYLPMEGRVAKKSEYTDYQSLKVNQTYSIAKETPLMPEFEPSDPLAAMSKIKDLPAGSQIKILSINAKYNFPWYEVQAINKSGEIIGRGWINSTALIGQDILIIR